MKTLTVNLADIEGLPHGSTRSHVKVAARYSGEVVLTDGTIIPTAIREKSLSTGGVVEFDVYASDDPTVKAEYHGFAVVVTATVEVLRGQGKGAPVRRTVKPLEAMASPISLGALAPAEPVAAPFTSVQEMLDSIADGEVTGIVQTISLSGSNLTLSDGGGTVTLPSSGGTGAVSSVNGQTGAVALDAADVGALPSTYTPPAQSWGVITGKPLNFPPSAHSHSQAEVAGLDAALSGKAAKQTPADYGTGAPSASTVLYGDGQWKAAPSGGGGSSDSPAFGWGPETATSNDTSALLAAMEAAKAAGKAFVAAPGTIYNIDPLDIPIGLRIEGALNVRGRTANQAYVLRALGRIEATGSAITIDCNSAVDGFVGYNLDRASFGRVDARYARRFGIHLAQTNGTATNGNNNHTSWTHVFVANNGIKHSTSSTVASQSGNANVINQGKTILTLATAVPSWALSQTVGTETIHSAYFVNISGKAYRVSRIISTTSIEIFNYPTTTAGTTVSVDVLIGAGMNIPVFHDNHVGWIGQFDAISNPSLGLHHSPGYGWTIGKASFQGNGIGLGVWDWSQSTTLLSPYFELNGIDLVIGTNFDATITTPLWPTLTLQSLWDRLSGREGTHPGLTIMGSPAGAGSRVGPLRTPEIPITNNGTLSLFPGYSYAFGRAAGNPAFRIAPAKAGYAYGAHLIDLTIEATGAWSGTCSFTMLTGGEYLSDTVMGGSSYTTPTLSAGVHRFTIFRNGTDWRVARISSSGA